VVPRIEMPNTATSTGSPFYILWRWHDQPLSGRLANRKVAHMSWPSIGQRNWGQLFFRVVTIPDPGCPVSVFFLTAAGLRTMFRARILQVRGCSPWSH